MSYFIGSVIGLGILAAIFGGWEPSEWYDPPRRKRR